MTAVATRRRFSRRAAASAKQTVSETKTQHAERLRTYNETFLICRDLRHAWEPSALWRDKGKVKRRLSCDRCGTQRVDCWTRWGEREAPRYIYPDAYQLKGDVYAAKEIRVEMMSRLSVFDSEETMIESVFAAAPRRGREPLRARRTATA